jgi:hypothetical protein
MNARKRKPLAARLFGEHPIRRGIEAGAYAHLETARRLSLNPQERERQIATIRRMFRDGRELLGWVLPPLSERGRSEVVLGVVKKMISLAPLPPEQKVEGLRLATKRPRGRPADSKYLAVYALEAKLARPESKWGEIAAFMCPCTKPIHDSCCTENLERQVGRLRALLRRTKIAPIILAATRNHTLRRNLRRMLG